MNTWRAERQQEIARYRVFQEEEASRERRWGGSERGTFGRLLWSGSGPEWGNWDVTTKEREGMREGEATSE